MHKKKVNYYLLLFLLCGAFLVWGLCATSAIQPVGESLWRLISGQDTLEEAKADIGEALDKNLVYHYNLLELNGLKERLLGTRVIQKDNDVVAIADSGSLMDEVRKLRESDIEITASKIAALRDVAEQHGAQFLYCAAPEKEMTETAPPNVDNYARQNYDLLLEKLAEKDVAAINYAQMLDEWGQEFPVFYDTDHHWTARAGFEATDLLVAELQQRYGFAPNETARQLSNYKVETYSDWFLGSKGKKVGAYFSPNGVDDFQLITPKFETDVQEIQPFKNSVRKGIFDKTVLYQSHLKKNYYKKNSYATYSGGDFRLQIMKNMQNLEGKKILMVRDSFACVVAPFLSLHTAELHVCDVRDGMSYVGDKVNMEQYIQEIQPDYVLVLYTGVGNSVNSKYDFFHPAEVIKTVENIK